MPSSPPLPSTRNKREEECACTPLLDVTCFLSERVASHSILLSTVQYLYVHPIVLTWVASPEKRQPPQRILLSSAMVRTQHTLDSYRLELVHLCLGFPSFWFPPLAHSSSIRHFRESWFKTKREIALKHVNNRIMPEMYIKNKHSDINMINKPQIYFIHILNLIMIYVLLIKSPFIFEMKTECTVWTVL